MLIDTSVEKSWEEFKTVSLDQNGRLKENWEAFQKGTSKEIVYGWFDRAHSKGINYLMKERKEE